MKMMVGVVGAVGFASVGGMIVVMGEMCHKVRHLPADRSAVDRSAVDWMLTFVGGGVCCVLSGVMVWLVVGPLWSGVVAAGVAAWLFCCGYGLGRRRRWLAVSIDWHGSEWWA